MGLLIHSDQNRSYRLISTRLPNMGARARAYCDANSQETHTGWAIAAASASPQLKRSLVYWLGQPVDGFWFLAHR